MPAFLKFLCRVLWRDAEVIDRVVEISGTATALLFGGKVGWIWGVMIFLGTLAFVFGRRAYILDEQSQPRIELRFGDNEKYLTATPYIGVTTNRDGKMPFVGQARYLRVEAINLGAGTAHNCRAFLLAIKQRGPNGEWLDIGFTEPMDLKWSFEDTAAVDLHSEIHKLFNILSAREGQDRPTFEFAKSTPLRFVDLCSKPGVYRMRVCVRGDDGAKSETLAIEVSWTCSAEEMTVEKSTWRPANISA